MALYLEKLNEKQLQAVTADSGPALVLAGAGSGKTRVLTTRLAYLVNEKNINPSSILAITFTNKAAREINKRVAEMFGGGIWFPWIGTFHSMCLKMLRMSPEAIGYKNGFVVYDMDDQKVLVKDCLKELDLDSKLFPPKSIMHHMNRSKDELIGPEEFISENKGDYRLSIIGDVYKCYQQHMVENNAMDFGDLIFNAVRLLREDDNARKYFQSSFKHILIDEYQDTNTAQYEFARLLSEKHRNIFVVGDDDQSIYGWRGANIRNILDFEKDYPGCLVIRLEQNYRSTTNILSAANDVIRNNFGRKEKTLWSDKGKGGKVRYYRADNDAVEAYFTANIIQKGVEEGRSYNDFAILYRMNAQSRNIEQALRERKIPYKIHGGLSYFQRKEVKDVLAYLKILVNADDSIQLKRIINEPKRGIGNVTLSRIEEIALETGKSMYEVAMDVDQYPILGSCSQRLKDFTEIIEKLKKAAKDKSLEDLYEEVIDKTGIIDSYKKDNSVISRSRIENIKELKSAIISMKEEYPEMTGNELTLETFLESVTLATDVDEDEEGAHVSIMTLHSAKGLEFPVVIITGMEEGVFPSMQSNDSQERMEEERRLCYVGITRAMEQVYLINTRQRTLYGRTQMNPESRFLKEIDDSLMERMGYEQTHKKSKGDSQYRRSISGGRISITRGGRPVSIAGYKAVAGAASDVNVGQRVSHKKFGEGTVIKTEGSGQDCMIDIEFDIAGKKRLMAAFAKLKTID